MDMCKGTWELGRVCRCEEMLRDWNIICRQRKINRQFGVGVFYELGTLE